MEAMEIMVNIMKIYEREKKSKREQLLNGARRYIAKLQESVDILMEFDEKDVDDILEVKRSYEMAGTPCMPATTQHGDKCLVDMNGQLLASQLAEERNQ